MTRAQQKRKTEDMARRWDWTLQNAELALRTGYSRERVRQLRERVGASRAMRHRKHLRSAEVRVKGVAAAGCWNTRQAADLLGVTTRTAARAARRAGVDLKPCWSVYPWHEVDWSQPNRVIAAKLGAKATVVAAHRARHGEGRSAEKVGSWLNK